MLVRVEGIADTSALTSPSSISSGAVTRGLDLQVPGDTHGMPALLLLFTQCSDLGSVLCFTVEPLAFFLLRVFVLWVFPPESCLFFGAQ